MIEVRRSILEEFARLTTTEYGDEAALVATIKGNPFEPNWMMLAGTAWHAAIEGAVPDGIGAGVEVYDGYAFDQQLILEARAYVGPGIHEVTGYAVFPTVHGPCRVEATADHIHGLAIQDHKTKFSDVDAESVENALQWRFYLHIHECNVFRYNFWHFRDPDANGYCAFRKLENMKFWRYPALAEECQNWVSDFCQWAHDRDLLPYLTSAKFAA